MATTRPTSRSAPPSPASRWRCCRWPRSTRRSCWSSRRSPIRSPATSGTATSSAPAATRSQDAISNARRARQGRQRRSPRSAQDYAFGRDGVKAVQGGARRTAPRSCHEEYLPTDDQRLHRAGAQRLFDALKDKPGRKVICRSSGPAPATRSRSPTSTSKRYGIEIATGGNILPAMVALQAVPGHGRRDLLLLRHPEEPGERLAGRRAPEAVQRRRPISSPPAA